MFDFFKNSKDDKPEYGVGEFGMDVNFKNSGLSPEEIEETIGEINAEMEKLKEKYLENPTDRMANEVARRTDELRQKAAVMSQSQEEIDHFREKLEVDLAGPHTPELEVNKETVGAIRKILMTINHHDDLQTRDGLFKLMLLCDCLMNEFQEEEEDRDFFNRLRVADPENDE